MSLFLLVCPWSFVSYNCFKLVAQNSLNPYILYNKPMMGTIALFYFLSSYIFAYSQILPYQVSLGTTRKIPFYRDALEMSAFCRDESLLPNLR